MAFQVLRPADPASAPPPAPFGRRVGAAALDVTIFLAVFAGLTMLWGEREGVGFRARGLGGCSLIPFIPIYWIATETWWKGTPGKLLLGLEVWSLNGSELGASQTLRRNLVKILDSPFLCLFSTLVALTNPLKQTAGDLWAKTMVTQSKALSEWRNGKDGRTFDDWLGSFKKQGDSGARCLKRGYSGLATRWGLSMNDEGMGIAEAENDDPVVVYRSTHLLEADLVAEAMDRAQIPHVRRIMAMGGWSVAMPANPGPGLLPGSFFAIAVPGQWVARAERFVASLPVSQEPPASHRMPGIREMFQGWTWIFVLAILLVLIVGVIRMFIVM